MFGVLLLAAVVTQAPEARPLPPGVPDPCAMMEWPGARKAWGATHPRTLRLGKALAKRMRMPMLVLCETSVPHAAPAALSKMLFDPDGPGRVAFVLVPREVADTYANPAFRGILAHEFAHVVLPDGHPCSFRNVMTSRERTVMEMELCEATVDEYAARWVGYDAMIAELRATQGALMPYMSEDYGLLLKAEVGLRTALLENLKEKSASKPRP